MKSVARMDYPIQSFNQSNCPSLECFKFLCVPEFISTDIYPPSHLVPVEMHGRSFQCEIFLLWKEILRQFHCRRGKPMAHRHVIKCPTSPDIKELQIKTTMTYHLTPTKMSIISKWTDKKCWWGCGEKGTLVYYWQECRLVQSAWRTAWSFLKKLKMQLLFDPEIPLLAIYPNYLETSIQKNVCTPMFIAVLFTIVKIW